LTGDYNGDGQVDAVDYTVWRNSLGSDVDLAADGNLNGTVFGNVVEFADYQRWKANYGSSLPGGSGGIAEAVPEPNSLLL
jgi:hypothetical protein